MYHRKGKSILNEVYFDSHQILAWKVSSNCTFYIYIQPNINSIRSHISVSQVVSKPVNQIKRKSKSEAKLIKDV